MRLTPQNSFSKLVLLNERTSTVLGSERFRYGYQGSEKDNEVKGEGNSYTTFYRQLDPRLGRWLTLDPMMAKLPWQSPYCSMDNNPIWFNDQLGDEADWQKGDKGSRKKDNANGSTTYDAPVGTVILPKRAKVLGTLQDGNGNGKVDYKGKTLEGEFGDLNKFELDKVVYTSKYSKGKFMGYFDANGNKYDNSKLEDLSKQTKAPEPVKSQELELSLTSASSGVSVGALGAELDAVGWQYYSVNGAKGWDESSIKMHDFTLLNSTGVGSSWKYIPKQSVEILSIGGGTLSIQSDYLKKHPTTSLIKLLNNKNIISYATGCAYKYSHFEIYSDQMEFIASGSAHSFSLMLPGASTRQGKTKFTK